MRISQDNDSWAAGGVIRRDFRHDNSTPEVAPNKSLKKSKNSPRKVARNKKKDIEKQKHIADGLKGHLWVWEQEIVVHAEWCHSTSYWGHGINWQTGDSCGFEKIYWKSPSIVRNAFLRGECIAIHRSICASCGKVDRIRYTLANDKNDWGY